MVNGNKLTSLSVFHYTDSADFSVGVFAVIGRPVFYCALLIPYWCSVMDKPNRWDILTGS